MYWLIDDGVVLCFNSREESDLSLGSELDLGAAGRSRSPYSTNACPNLSWFDLARLLGHEKFTATIFPRLKYSCRFRAVPQ
jgi:hypothetical protein